MDPLTAGAVVGGLGVAGSMLTGQMSSENAQKQMDFQKMMSDSAHQREVADLRAAGLNPILSASGSGASTPSGAMATAPEFGSAISHGADTAIAVRAQNKQLDVQDADIDLKHDQATSLASDRALNIPKSQAANYQAQQEGIKTDILRQTANSVVKKAKAEGDFAPVNQLMGVIGAGVSSAKDVKDLLNPVSGIIRVNNKGN